MDGEHIPCEAVGIVASAGGLNAISQVLRGLPSTLPAVVVVLQHLSPSGSVLVDILARRSAMPVIWAEAGQAVEPGRVVVVPSHTTLRVTADHTVITEQSAGAHEHPGDALLASLGESYGEAALGVVLTGLGDDGTEGARALREHGGTVVIQDPETAAEASMPLAVREAGEADLELLLEDIGPEIVRRVGGAARR